MKASLLGTWALGAIAICGCTDPVTPPDEDIDEGPLGQAASMHDDGAPGEHGSGGPPPPRYTIEELPTDVAGGVSSASRAICGPRAVVGTTSVTTVNDLRAIVLDASGVRQLGTLGGSTSHGRAGNPSGAIVGGSSTGSSTHAFVYRNGQMTDLGTLGGAFSDAFAINHHDQIVGQSTLVTGGDVPSHATLWQDCTAIDLGTLGGAESFARDINNAGVIVGTSSRADDPVRAHAVVWRNRVIEQLETGDALHSQAVAINEAGTIAGYAVYAAGAPYHGVIWRDGVLTDLGNLGGSTFALGLNEQGDVVGMSWDASGSVPHAFLYQNGQMLDLQQLADAPGWTLLQATDTCDDGRIVGNGWLNGGGRGFVLTPVAGP